MQRALAWRVHTPATLGRPWTLRRGVDRSKCFLGLKSCGVPIRTPPLQAGVGGSGHVTAF